MNFSVHKRRLKIVFNDSSLRNFIELKFDKRRLQQVLLNLLSNACKFQREGMIQVDSFIMRGSNHNHATVSNSEVFITVIVEDKGAGIA